MLKLIKVGKKGNLEDKRFRWADKLCCAWQYPNCIFKGVEGSKIVKKLLNYFEKKIDFKKFWGYPHILFRDRVKLNADTEFLVHF